MDELRLNSYQRDMIRGLIESAVADPHRPSDVAPVLATVGGWGCGKTATQAIALWAVARRFPGAELAWITDKADRRRRVIQPEAERWFIGGWYDGTSRCWSFSNGSKIWLMEYFRPSTVAAEANPLEGANLVGGAIDECQIFGAPEVAKRLRGRLRQKIDGLRPFILLAGLPVLDAWWASYAENAGGLVFRPTSYVNEENQAPGYLDSLRQELDDDEYQAYGLGRPMPLTGLVLSGWRADGWPDGNLLEGWRYSSATPTAISIDFGLNRPTAALIQHDKRRDLDVIYAEVMPGPRTITEFADEVLAVAWPRKYAGHKPKGVEYMIDEGVGDPAGRAGNTHRRLSDIDVLGQPPNAVDSMMGGIGVRIMYDTDPIKKEIEGSLLRLQRRIHFHGQRRLVMTRELWEAGLKAPQKQRTLARCIIGHARDARGRIKDDPFKDGVDVLRYWARRYHWFERPMLEGRVPVLSAANRIRPASASLGPISRWR